MASVLGQGPGCVPVAPGDRGQIRAHRGGTEEAHLTHFPCFWVWDVFAFATFLDLQNESRQIRKGKKRSLR